MRRFRRLASAEMRLDFKISAPAGTIKAEEILLGMRSVQQNAPRPAALVDDAEDWRYKTESLVDHDAVMAACFVSAREIRLFLLNRSSSPLNVSSANDRFFFYTRDGRIHELLTEKRIYSTDELLEGDERTYPFELSLAEAKRINPVTIRKALCLVGGSTYVLFRIEEGRWPFSCDPAKGERRS